jgi:hypothetical protein
MKKSFFSTFISVFLFIIPVKTNTVKVNSLKSLQLAINKAVPGDKIIVANGIYVLDVSITIIRHGTADQPVTIEAETTVNIDIDGQTRKYAFDTGADQYSDAPKTNRPLTPADVGPDALKNIK